VSDWRNLLGNLVDWRITVVDGDNTKLGRIACVYISGNVVTFHVENVKMGSRFACAQPSSVGDICVKFDMGEGKYSLRENFIIVLHGQALEPVAFIRRPRHVVAA